MGNMKGFTLIEGMIVAAIIVTLLALLSSLLFEENVPGNCMGQNDVELKYQQCLSKYGDKEFCKEQKEENIVKAKACREVARLERSKRRG